MRAAAHRIGLTLTHPVSQRDIGKDGGNKGLLFIHYSNEIRGWVSVHSGC